MTGKKIAYKRVSSSDQSTARQLPDEDFDKVFTDQASGKSTDARPGLEGLIDYVREDDTVIVHSIDRLARNLQDLQQIIEQITTQGASVEFRKESLRFTGGDTGSDPMNRLMLQMMGAFAEFERSLIRERQREGIAAAQAAGKKFGRPEALTPDQKISLRAKKRAGVSVRKLMDEFNVSKSKVYATCRAD